MFAVFVHLFQRFIFAISSQVTKASSEQSLRPPPSPPDWVPQNKHLTANCLQHFGGPHRYYTLAPLARKQNKKHSFCIGGWRGSRTGRRLPGGSGGVSAQVPQGLQMRDWRYEGKSLTVVSVLLRGRRKKRSFFSWTCWEPHVLISASHKRSQWRRGTGPYSAQSTKDPEPRTC